jgi:hypothetical protein
MEGKKMRSTTATSQSIRRVVQPSPTFAPRSPWNIVIALVAGLGAGMGAQPAHGQRSSIPPNSMIASAQATDTNGPCKWSASGKHSESDLAQCLASSGSEQLELRFYKHEFDSVAVWLPETRELNGQRKSLAEQEAKNQETVTLSLDDVAPVIETWAIVQDPSNNLQYLLPKQGNYSRIYKLLLACKKFTITYPDKSGKPIIAVFDVSAVAAQVDIHNEKMHHSGLKDALEVGGAALGPL